jgi:RNA polymerase-binding protein DksA
LKNKKLGEAESAGIPKLAKRKPAKTPKKIETHPSSTRKKTRQETPSPTPRPNQAKSSVQRATFAVKSTTGHPTNNPPIPANRNESPLPSSPRTAIGTNGETIELVDPEKPLPKTTLSAKELREFKELLRAKRRELLGDVSQLSNEALHSNRQDAAGDLSNMPSHMADIGSDNWEQEFTLGLIATEHALLREIDDALERIENRTYGICLATHRVIGTKRLLAKPWARYCIEYARLREAGRAP